MVQVQSYNPQIHHRRSIRLAGYDYSRPGAYFVTLVCYQRQTLFGEIGSGEMRLNPLGEIVRDQWESTPSLRPDIRLGEYVVMPNHFHAIVIITDPPPPVQADSNPDPVRADGDPDPVRADGDPDPVRAGSSPPQLSPPLVRAYGSTPRPPIETDSSPDIIQAGSSPPQPSPPLVRAYGSTPQPTPRQPQPTTLGALIRGYKAAVTHAINTLRNTPGTPVWQRNYWEHIIRSEASYERIANYILNNPIQWEIDSFHQGATK